MKTVRIAICQLESHPALYFGAAALLEEPFVPAHNKPSLAKLGARGIDVISLQQGCLEHYLGWNQVRIASVLTFLETVAPLPDLVLLPEGSIPIELLPSVGEWSSKTGATVLAGTHTPRRTPHAQECYRAIGLDAKGMRQLFKYQSSNVLPLIRTGHAVIIPKRHASPFETSTSSTVLPATPSLRPFSSGAPQHIFELLPMICSEALQLSTVAKPYDVVGLLAYDSRPTQFGAFISTQVRNKKAVAFCNDGAFGGSSIATALDNRMSSWLHETLPNGLPAGDAILVADIDLDVTAVEVGTAVPGVSMRLVLLASIVGEHHPASEAARQMAEVRELGQSTARAAQLEELLRRPLETLQRVRLDQLLTVEARGLPSEELWRELGRDCILPGLSSLRELEAQLSSRCSRYLTPLLGSSLTQKEEVAIPFMQYLAECNRRMGAQAPDDTKAKAEDYAIAIVDRERETSSVHLFLDEPTQLVLEVTGLNGIGKTSTLKKALTQSGISATLRIILTDTSSVDYILYSVLQYGGGQPRPPYSDPAQVASGPALRAALRSIRVLILEGAHYLLDRDAWRDARFPSVIAALLDSADATRTKIIIESRHELPLALGHPASRAKLHVRGLSKEANRFGVALFDAQLRRVNLLPSVVGDREKSTIVDKLGGHPVAIALAADVSYEEGVDALLASLRDRRGFFLHFLEELVRGLKLTDDQATVMRLLCVARSGVPRAVILESVPFAAGPSLRELIAMGAVEVGPNGWVEVASVLRDYFDSSEVPPDVLKSFHAAAAQALARMVQESDGGAVGLAVEAEYHAALGGIESPVSTGLVDGAVATAQEFYAQQRYDEAAAILAPLARAKQSLDILRLAAQVEARRNNFDAALSFAREVFKRNPRDTSLLAELSKITLTQFQDEITEQLVSIARSSAVEDVSIMIVEGRLHLRRGNFPAAETVLRKAAQLTEKNPWPFFYLGRTLIRSGKLDEAIDVLHAGEEFYFKVEARGRAALDAIRTQLGIAYLLDDKLELAATILESVLQQDKPNPEGIRALAALAIKRDGVKEAHQVLERLQEAGIKSRADEAQFRLLYGLFYLGIDDLNKASAEFGKAHNADRTNVFVMMKWARTLFDLAVSRFSESDETYKVYVTDCARLVRKILEFDPDNHEGVRLMESLRNRFGVDI